MFDPVELELRVNTAAWETGLNSAIQMLAGFNQKLAGIARGAKPFMTPTTLGITAAVLALGAVEAKAISVARQWESGFAGVKKTVTASADEMIRLEGQLKNLYTSIPAPMDELLGVAQIAGQMGLAADEIAGFTEQILMLSEATDMTAERGALVTAQFGAISNMDSSNFSNFAATLTHLGNNLPTTENRIASMGLRIAAAGTAAGMSQDQILGIAGAFSSMGVAAEMGGSTISRVIIALDSATGSKAQAFADVIGVTADQFMRMRDTDAAGTMEAFVQGLGRIQTEGGNIGPVLEELGLGGVRVADVFGRAANNSGVLSDALRLSASGWTENSALATEYAARMDTVDAKLQLFRNRVTAGFEALGRLSLPALAATLDGLSTAALSFGDKFGPSMRDAAAGVGALASAIGPLVGFLGGIALDGLVLTLEGVAGALSLMGAAATGIGAVVGGLGGLAMAFEEVGAAGPIVMASLSALVLLKWSAIVSGAAAAGSALMTFAGAATAAMVAMGPGLLLFAAGVAVLAGVGMTIRNAAQHAEEAAGSFKDSFAQITEAADFSQLEQSISGVRDRMEELREIDKVSDGLGGGLESWGTALKSVYERLNPFAENTVADARAELVALDQALRDTQAEQYATGIRSIADSLGITPDAAMAAANQLGLVEEVTRRGATSFHDLGYAINPALQAIRDLTAGATPMAEAMGVTTDAIMQGEITMGNYEAALKLTGSSVEYLVGQIEGLSMDDLFDPEKSAEAFYAVESLAQAYGRAAEAIGMTGQQMIEQLVAVGNLAQAYGELSSAVSGYKSALDTLGAADLALDQANVALEAAKTGFDGTRSSAMEYASALRDVVLAAAAAGTGVEGTIELQQQLASEFIAVATAAGMGRDEIQELLVQFGLVPESVITEIDMKADGFQATAQQVEEVLNDIAAQPFIAQIQADTGAAKTDIAEAYLLLGSWETTEAVAVLSADSGVAMSVLTDLMAAGVQWEQLTATADLIAAGEPARVVMQSLLEQGVAWDAATYEAILAATDDASADVAIAQAAATGYAAQPYIARIQATDEATPVTDIARAAATGYAAQPYNASLTATDSASATVDIARAAATGYAAQPYNASLTATDNASAVTAVARANATGYAAQPYVGRLTAVDNASGTISAAKAMGEAFAKTYTATIVTKVIGDAIPKPTNTTSTHTIVTNTRPGNAFALGALTVAGGHRMMADGDVLGRQAQMRPGGSWITWAEDRDGESYIPHALHKRPRSMRILQETANLFDSMVVPMSSYRSAGGVSRGVYGGSGGGSAPAVVFSPSVTITGVSDERVAARVRQELDRELRDLTRNMNLALPGYR